MNLSGTVLKGRYCILDPVGKGGGGKVYLARDLELGVLWAIKEIPVSDKSEARMLLKLSHPSLPKMIDYIEDNRKCYLVMEYVRGKSLGEYLRGGKHFSINEIVKYGMEISDVFSYFHGRKPPVNYGDLKPDNLMLGENGRLYLIDLGGAVNGYKYHHKVCTGTAGFAAPEQYEGKINAATDIYTFGKTLSALCGKTDCLLFIRNMSLFWLIFRCCMKKPEMRYQNMKTVQKKLSRIQKRQNQSKIKNMLVLAGSSIAFAVITVFLLFSSDLVSGSKTFDFYEELTDITDLYYQEEFQNGSKADREKICVQEYTLDSDTKEDNVTIKAIADDERANITGTGNIKLQTGENNLRVDVSAENGTVRTYLIKVTRKIQDETLRLSSIKLNAVDQNGNKDEVDLSPSFSENIFSYTAKIYNGASKIDVDTSCLNENAKITVEGNENLKDGKNTIIITVSKEGKTETVSYKIDVIRESSRETSNIPTDKKDNKTAICVIMLLAVIVIFMLLTRKKNGKH